MDDSDNVPARIQALIRKERARLDNERRELSQALAKNRADIDALMKQCAHPRAVISKKYGYTTTDCPDCGHSALFVEDSLPRRRHRGKEK
jgi:hypothetical protein